MCGIPLFVAFYPVYLGSCVHKTVHILFEVRLLSNSPVHYRVCLFVPDSVLALLCLHTVIVKAVKKKNVTLFHLIVTGSE